MSTSEKTPTPSSPHLVESPHPNKGAVDVFEENPDHDIHYKTLSWQFVSLLMIAEIVSNGMLSLPSALAVVGIVPAVVLIVFLGVFGLFTAKLLIDFKLNHPNVHSMGDAGMIMGGPFFRELLSAGTVIFAICATGAEILSGQQALSSLSNNGLCAMYFLLIFAVATFVLSLPRTLDRLSWIGLFSVLLIMVAGVVAMIGAGLNSTPGRTISATTKTDFYQAFLAITNPVFSYAGFNELQAAWCLQGSATVFYTLFAVIIAGGLYSHTAAKLVFVRFFRHTRHIYSHTVKGWAVWVALCFFAVALAFVLAIAVPIFSYLIGIAAALFASWYTYGLAGFFWLYDTVQFEGRAGLRRRPVMLTLSILTIISGAFICVAGTYVSIKLITVAYSTHIVGKPFRMSNKPGLYSIPISARPPTPWKQTFKAIGFIILWMFAAIMINGSQFVFLLPIRLLPFRSARSLYYEGIRWTKGCLGCLLILMCQWFAPTRLRITFETQGPGKFSKEEIERVAVRNSKGEVISLNLPTKFVLTANHQIYADWWYAWCLLYFIGPTGVHRHMFITLKKSLQWIPIAGWGMQFFNFIFLARSWAADRLQLATQLASLGKEARKENRPFCFLLYPEGTLVSKDTRPISKKFADKMGIADMKNTLLPRSTGLHYSLRSLAPRIPDLKLLDLTVVYPGKFSKFQLSYYTLRSIFFNGVSPPAIHMHLRLFDVREDIPIGDLSSTMSSPDVPEKGAVEVDIPAEEKENFDLWLRNLWREKDEAIAKYYETGTLETIPEGSTALDIPLKLRRKREILDAFCCFFPAGLAYLLGRARH
ncbi:hypothetical protein NP233_g11742 [Leucocoprinus birnbaumii]|uniref:Phospholipid/glycerol acyltransferase domain-containing protein n=1 Tax=Leucocoprinus birnbaumii TaxID=56174 RepID=A0AAD5YK37_9AGAR|nr:hypothetical protein NP233_g11742 [Leucocoprinus birnbaumii]